MYLLPELHRYRAGERMPKLWWRIYTTTQSTLAKPKEWKLSGKQSGQRPDCT